MGGNFSRDDFDKYLDRAKLEGSHDLFSVNLGRDFTKSVEARDPKCVWARLDGAPRARVRLSRGHISDLVTIYEPQYQAQMDAAGDMTMRRVGTSEVSHAITHDEASKRSVMEERTMKLATPREAMPSFSGLKIYFGPKKWRLTPLYVNRRGSSLCNAAFLVHEGGLKGGIEHHAIVGFIKVDDFMVTDFAVEKGRMSPLMVGALLYVLTRVYNGIIRVPDENIAIAALGPLRPVKVTS